MNPERTPYAAIADLESVVKTIAAESKGRVLILFDPQKGWWAGDEIDELVSDEKSGALLVKGRTYLDWRRDNIAEALSALAAARFIPGSTVAKLFRKAPPAPGGASTSARQAAAVRPAEAKASEKKVVATGKEGAKKAEVKASPAPRR